MCQSSSSCTRKPNAEKPHQGDGDIAWWKSKTTRNIAFSVLIHDILTPVVAPEISPGPVVDGQAEKENGKFHRKSRPMLGFSVDKKGFFYPLSRYPPQGAIHTPVTDIFHSRKVEDLVGKEKDQWLKTQVVLNTKVQVGKDCSTYSWRSGPWKPSKSEIVKLMMKIGEVYPLYHLHLSFVI